MGMLPLVCNAPACRGLLVVVGFSYGHRLLFGALLLAKISSSSFSVGLQHFGEWEGLLAAASSGKSGCPLCFVDASERGVSPRLEVGGVSLFCAGFALSRLRLICFEARLSGYCVREGGGQGSQPWVLVLAFSTRTLKSSGVPARRVPAGGFCVGMLTLACSTPACPGLLVVVRFRGVHRCCFLGCCFPLSKDPLVVKLSAPCWLAALRGVGGAFGGAGSWLLQVSRKSGCPSCCTGCWCWQ